MSSDAGPGSVANAASIAIDDEFDERFKSSRAMRFAGDDPIVGPLSAALLQAEAEKRLAEIACLEKDAENKRLHWELDELRRAMGEAR